MKAMVIPNLDKVNAKECTKKVIVELNSLSIDVLISDRHSEELSGIKACFVEFFDGIKSCDVVIAIGGDGTIIHAAKHAVEVDKPLLGINVGRLGFMAGIEMSELSQLLGLKNGSYSIEERMLLECVHITKNDENTYLALNDVVVSNGALSRIIELDISCGDRQIITHRADGIILSTPTGSTAYALSAGGPVIEPSMNCISLTPICPHSLLSRTVIFKENSQITVRGSALNLHPIYITVDGEDGAKLEEQDSILVRRSEKTVKLITLNDKSFYEVLSNKFLLNKN
ncbi:MAG: NAD(+)/NADH kinase [Oscillospiraceae bacterium]